MLVRTEEQKDEVRLRRVTRLERKQSARFAINCFILYHICAVIVWNLPYSQNGIVGIVAPYVRPYMTSSGIMQSWLMFCPNPDNNDIYVEARITYQDQSIQSWDYPRMAKLGYMEKYRLERYRKLIENGSKDTNQILWPALARFAAIHNWTDPKNPPKSVELLRHFRLIPDPGHRPGVFTEFSFYHRNFTLEELR